MLYWPKFLITAYAITNTLEPFIPLYLINQLQLTALQVAIVVAIIYLLRLFSGTYTALVDNRAHLYGVAIATLTVLSSISFIVVLSLSTPYINKELNDTWIWTLVIICTVLNGLFYQPLGSLIDSAIIKTLGDFRVLFYGSYVRWNKSTTIIMTGLIGWLINITGDRFLDTILVTTWVIGMILLLLVALLFTSVEPANSNQLDISDEQAPLLLKNALHLTADQNSISFPSYKPYSIFGEQLSHISEEEDSSQLERMFTNENSLRHVDSYDSTPSFYSGLHHQYSSRYNEENNQLSSMTIIPTVPSNALALLPVPTPTDPLVAFFPWMRPDQDNLQDDLLVGQHPFYYYNQNQNSALSKINNWKTNTLSLTLFLLGVSYTLLNTFLFIYVYTILEISLYMIACLIMIHTAAEMIVSFIIEKWFIHRLNLTMITTSVHIILILCAILYPCLKPDTTTTNVSLLVLQMLQAIAFQTIWLSGADQVNLIMWSQYDRMKHRSKISALFSSIGPAIGALLAGYILQSNTNMEDYAFIYKMCVALFSLSFVVSWGWTSDN